LVSRRWQKSTASKFWGRRCLEQSLNLPLARLVDSMEMKTVHDVSTPSATVAKEEEVILWFIASQIHEWEKRQRANNNENTRKG
jgi:hypothetical protein